MKETKKITYKGEEVYIKSIIYVGAKLDYLLVSNNPELKQLFKINISDITDTKTLQDLLM